MEEKTLVKTFQIDYRCPKCYIGYLRFTGETFYDKPIDYPHSCNNSSCDHKDVFNKKYPYITTELA